MVVGFGLMTSIYWIFRWTPPSRVDRWFRRLQLVSAAVFSLNHGANDAQKTMGIIAGVLFAGRLHPDVLHSVLGDPGRARRDWAGHAGGRLAHHPHDGIEDHQAAAGRRVCRGDRRGDARFSSRRSSASRSARRTRSPARLSASGATRRLSAVRWGVARQIVWAWVLTIPAAFAIGAGTYLLLGSSGARCTEGAPPSPEEW